MKKTGPAAVFMSTAVLAAALALLYFFLKAGYKKQPGCYFLLSKVFAYIH
jgi:hypothetical protein